MRKTYTCQKCQGTFPDDDPDDEAPEGALVLCEDCDNRVDQLIARMNAPTWQPNLPDLCELAGCMTLMNEVCNA